MIQVTIKDVNTREVIKEIYTDFPPRKGEGIGIKKGDNLLHTLEVIHVIHLLDNDFANQSIICYVTPIIEPVDVKPQDNDKA